MYVDVIEVRLFIDFTTFQIIPEYILKQCTVQPAYSETAGDQFFFLCKEAPFHRGT
jgi:hypothetical protein